MPGIGAALGTALNLGLQALPYAGSALSAIPGPLESQYRKDIKADRERLANGAGGMSTGQRQALYGEGMGQVNAQLQSALAQQSRGAGGMADGVAQQQQLELYRMGQQAGQQVGSSVRNQDLALGEQQRADLRNRMLQAMQLGMARKAGMVGSMPAAPNGMDPNTAFAAGQQGRTTAGSSVQSATDMAVGPNAQTTSNMRTQSTVTPNAAGYYTAGVGQ